MPSKIIIALFALLLNASCNNNITEEITAATTEAPQPAAPQDYIQLNRVKIMDTQAFTEPAEAYSILLPEGWQHEGGVFWTAPQQICAGTNMNFIARSSDQQFSFQILPAITWNWSQNPHLQQIQQQQTSTYCGAGEPITAQTYVEQVWLKEWNNASIIAIKENQAVANSLGERDQEVRAEMMRYGAANVNYQHTAVTATVQLPNEQRLILTCGVTNAETIIPNQYNGTYDMNYTSSASRMVFQYPNSKQDEAEQLASVLIASLRTNPAWKQATDTYWRGVREHKQQEHLGKIRMIDEQTRQIAKRAIADGNQRLAAIDTELRTWEAKQSSQDRIHSNFIKTIREVEHYTDETGTIELSSGYNHAWSRSDGTSFILTNSPNLDPSSVFQDQRWKEMRKKE